jgi:hypothetical protein
VAARVIRLLVAMAACVPIAAVLTWLAWPAFGWFEARTGIEALGHSGPAGWCHGAMLAACWLLSAMALLARGRRR